MDEQGSRDPQLLDVVEAELGDVERALERLEEGSYSSCEACGGPIEEHRLELHPLTRRCENHASPMPTTNPTRI